MKASLTLARVRDLTRLSVLTAMIGFAALVDTAETMKLVFLFAWLMALSIGGCAWVPRAGPSASEVIDQSRTDGDILFDIVMVDDQVVATLRAQPKESFAARFKEDTQPPPVRIAIGDVVSVVIWESAPGGLFTEPVPTLPPRGGAPGVEPL